MRCGYSHDLYYVEHWSPWFDLRILALTLWHIDDPQRALTGTPTDASATIRPEAPPFVAPRTIVLAFGAAVMLCLLAYLAYAVPGRWVSSVSEKAYGAAQLSLPRGTATVSGDELVARAADDGNTVISVATDFRSADFPVVAWIAAGFPADARVALLWRTDVEPARVNRRALDVADGQLLPADVHRDPHWLGRIVGLALVVQGSIDQPVRVRGVIAKPADAWDTLRDRTREWTAPEPWTGASINTVTGGADVQQLSLPLLLVAAVALTVAAMARAALARSRGCAAIAGCAIVAALAAWFVLDARWVVNLVRQAHATRCSTRARIRTRSISPRRIATCSPSSKARAVLPKDPARVFVVSDADFFRGRAAYHLYPHNVWYEPYRNAVPPAGKLRAGDWLVVYQRRGVQYDAARHSLRWDDGATVAADLKLDHGAALFLVQ